MTSVEAVANEPRLFVGQVPAECSEEHLWPLFSPFGTVRNLHILRGPDSKPRGCAMVLFAKWGEAEAAAESLEGTTTLSGGQGRPLVVHFANPRRLPPGQPPEGGLAPKKLFVGQVPRDVTEDMLRPFFEPYGDIEYINILRTQRGQSAGCGFVQYRKWAQAEAALEAHNGKTRLGNSEVPLVVKFADAKRRDQNLNHLGLPMRGPGWMSDLHKHIDPAAEFAAYQLGAQQWQNQGLLRNPLMGNSLLGNQLAQVQNLMPQQGYQAPYGQQGPYLQNHPLIHQHQIPQIADEAFNPDSDLNERLQEQQFGGSLGAQADPLAAQLISGATNLTSLNLSKGSSGQATPGQAQAGIQPASGTADLAQQLGRLQLSGLEQQVAGQNETSGIGYGQSSTGQMGYGGAGRVAMPGGVQGFPGAPQQTGRGGAPYNQQLLNLARGYMGGSALGRPWGQKIGSNDKYNEWKLFIGQVPLEATEETIWELFSPIGPILELYILRNNNGKSRGCAFVTYQSKVMAEKAITALNGCHMSSGKILVVKFADRSSATKAATPTQQTGNLLDMYSVP